MSHKIELLFDASNLAVGTTGSPSRTGIYFATQNILDETLKREDVNVTIYSEENKIEEVKCSIENLYPNKKFQFLYKTNKVYTLYKSLDKKRHEYYLKRFKRRYFLKALMVFIKFLYKTNESITRIQTGKLLRTIDAYFSPLYHCESYIKRYKNIKQFIVLHDAIPLILNNKDTQMGKNEWFMRIFNNISNDVFYFANSECTKRDFLRLKCDISSDRILVVPHACAGTFKKDIKNLNRVILKYKIPRTVKYIFSLCTLEPRKNLIRSVKTFIEFVYKNSIQDLIFVLGGAHWETFLEKLELELSIYPEWKNKIMHIGYVDDEDRATLYSGAQWFVYTSQYEGFGVPPLEAMQCGCPVIVSNSSSLPEVVGDAGLLIDWDSDEQHIRAYETYYFDEELRKEYSQRGLQQAKKFSWKKTTDVIINTIHQKCNI